MSDNETKNSGTDQPTRLEPLKLNKRVYPYDQPSHQHPFLSSSEPFKDDEADDLQPRYRMYARLIDRKTHQLLYEGEAFTLIAADGTHLFGMHDPTCHASGLAAYVVSLEGHLLDRPEFQVHSDDLLLTHLGSLNKSPDEPCLKGSLGSLVVTPVSAVEPSELASRVDSVYVPLYNCTLPYGGGNRKSEYWARPCVDIHPIELKWKGYEVHIGSFDGHTRPREEALLRGSRAVPTAFLVFKGGDFQRDPREWQEEIWRDILQFVIAMSLATLSPTFVRFWEYRDKDQKPIARVHCRMWEQTYSPGAALLPDRSLLGSFLEKVGSSIGVMDLGGWWQAIFLLIESSRHHPEHGLGGLYEQYTAVFQCLEALKSANLKNGPIGDKWKKYERIMKDALLDAAREQVHATSMKELFDGWQEVLRQNPAQEDSNNLKVFKDRLTQAHGELYKGQGLETRILTLEKALDEKALDIGVSNKQSERATFASKMQKTRNQVIHTSRPIQAPGPISEKDLEDMNYLSLYQLHAARILLALVGYTGYFSVRHFHFKCCTSHTSYTVPLNPDQLEKDGLKDIYELPAAMARARAEARTSED